MLQVFRVSVRRALRGDARFLQRRRFSAAGGASCVSRRPSSAERKLERGCTVDPEVEEQFVFVDCTAPEEELRPEELFFSSFTAAPRFHLHPLEKKQKKKATGDGGGKEQGGAEEQQQQHELLVPRGAPCCPGCGAPLQCIQAGLPGFLPSEAFRDLGSRTCQRCHLLAHQSRALRVSVEAKQFEAVVAPRLRGALLLVVVDLLELPQALPPALRPLLARGQEVVLLGNKVDLLPPDSPDYLRRLRARLATSCLGEDGQQGAQVHLISARTGYGVEALVSALQRRPRWRGGGGDIYLVGGANAGKSTLFNALLGSDLCKVATSDPLRRATVSPWPGTTLNLLRFPLLQPTAQRLLQRRRRLQEVARQTEEELPQEELRRLRLLSRQGYLLGRVGRTFQVRRSAGEVEFDPDRLAFGGEEEEEEEEKEDKAGRGLSVGSRGEELFSASQLQDARWLYDTPGVLKQHDILQLLSPQEVMSVVPAQALVPRTFVLKPSMTLFVGGLARVDFLEGGTSCWFSVLASARIPVHVTSLDKADALYRKHAGHALLGVPCGGSERMSSFPPLLPQEVQLEARSPQEASADLTLSSAGWVAVTLAGQRVVLRLHGPQGDGGAPLYGVRTPPLLPHVVRLRGERVGRSPAYRMLRPAGLLGGGALTSGGGAPGVRGGAPQLRVENKKKKK